MVGNLRRVLLLKYYFVDTADRSLFADPGFLTLQLSFCSRTEEKEPILRMHTYVALLELLPCFGGEELF